MSQGETTVQTEFVVARDAVKEALITSKRVKESSDLSFKRVGNENNF